jgi:histidine triad (HIT) family protein
MTEERCVFCDIVTGTAPAQIVYKDELSLALLDINPLAEGHCLIIPRRHVPWWHDLTMEETQSLFQVAKIVAERIMQTFRPDFVCMYARGRRMPHTHIFLVPTSQGDPLDRFFNALEGFQETPESLTLLKQKDRLKETADRLRKKTLLRVNVKRKDLST